MKNITASISRHKKTTALFLSVITLLVVFFYFAPVVFAQQNIINTTDQALAVTPLKNTDPKIIIANIINVLLGVLGLVAVSLIIYGGFIYMTSKGEDAGIKKAKSIIKNAVIGLAIIILSFSIVSFIISKLSEITGLTNTTTKQYTYTPPGLGSSGLGRVLQDHYPGVGMTVPRNTVLLVTFIDPIKPSSVITAASIKCYEGTSTTVKCSGATCATVTPDPANSLVCKGQVNKAAMKIYETCDSTYAATANKPSDFSEANRLKPEICNEWRGNPPADADLVGGNSDDEVTVTPDFRTIVFNPYGYAPDTHLGSAVNDTAYLVELENAIVNLQSNKGVFNSQNIKMYSWDFITNTYIDTTPPFVTGVYPVEVDAAGNPVALSDEAGNAGYPRNSRVRIDFSEPIIPPVNVTLGETTNVGTAEALVIQDSGVVVNGNLYLSNGYKSLIFRPSDPCDTGVQFNSCGDPLTCLPKNATIDGKAFSVPVANLINQIGPTATTYPAQGIIDAAMNALDTKTVSGRSAFGMGNGQTNGRDNTKAEFDIFTWRFKTSDLVDLIPPKLVSVTPTIGADASSGVTSLSEVSGTFNKSLDPSTTTNSNAYITSSAWNGWYTATLACPDQVAADGVSHFCFTNDKKLMINHGAFSPVNEGEAPIYNPLITSKVQDMLGNCFNPCGGATGSSTACSPQTTGKACCAVYPATGLTPQSGPTCPYSISKP